MTIVSFNKINHFVDELGQRVRFDEGFRVLEWVNSRQNDETSSLLHKSVFMIAELRSTPLQFLCLIVASPPVPD
jgi:hypothetical protein